MEQRNSTTSERLSFGDKLLSPLEMFYIEEYLQSKGFTLDDLAELEAGESRALMKEACKYASLKLAEIEARAKVRRNIRISIKD